MPHVSVLQVQQRSFISCDSACSRDRAVDGREVTHAGAVAMYALLRPPCPASLNVSAAALPTGTCPANRREGSVRPRAGAGSLRLILDSIVIENIIHCRAAGIRFALHTQRRRFQFLPLNVMLMVVEAASSLGHSVHYSSPATLSIRCT